MHRREVDRQESIAQQLIDTRAVPEDMDGLMNDLDARRTARTDRRNLVVQLGISERYIQVLEAELPGTYGAIGGLVIAAASIERKSTSN